MSWIKFSGRRLDGAYPCLALANSTCQCSSWSKKLRSGMVFLSLVKNPVRVRLCHQDRNGGMSWMNVNPGFFSWWGSPAVIIWYLSGTLMKQPWKLGQTSRGKNTQGPWWMIAYIYIYITRMDQPWQWQGQDMIRIVGILIILLSCVITGFIVIITVVIAIQGFLATKPRLFSQWSLQPLLREPTGCAIRK